MISVDCLKGLPNDYESFLIDRYNSYYTTCRYIEIFYPTYDINYILVREDGNLIDLLIFGNDGSTATCFNSLVEIGEDIIVECTKELFKTHASLQKIIINAFYKSYNIKRSVLSLKCNDHIVDLPASLDEYYSMLGYHTRKNSKNRKVRLLRDYPDAKFNVKYGAEIDERLIDRILQLNIDRMKSKGIVPGSDKYKDRIFQYSQHYGCVAYIEIDGVVIAGFISTILGKRIFGHVIAHDNTYCKYNPGEVCQFYLIQTAIEKGFKTFHYSSGDNEYKKRMLANPHSMFSYILFRKYSFEYFYTKISVAVSIAITDFRLSRYSKPLRDAIKSYRKKKYTSN